MQTQEIEFLLFIYLAVINGVTFILFAVDKWKAKHQKWRIREFMLLGCSLIGGAPGGLFAMRLFRHKTKKAYFVWGLRTMLILQILLFFYLWRIR